MVCGVLYMDVNVSTSQKKLMELLYDMLQISEQLNVPIYLVGGSVRDALLKRPFYDLDFVIESHIELLSHYLKERYDVKYSQRDTLNFQVDSYHVDVAMFRSEQYFGGSGLPTLDYGDFETDLMRRDFTINTAYLKIDEKNIHKLINDEVSLDSIYKSHPMFVSDLQSGTLRILIKEAFVQDPTRLLRAVKYHTLLNFNFDHETASCFNQAIQMKVIHHCAPGRYKNILYAYLQLSDYKGLLKNLYKWDLLRGDFSSDFFEDMGDVLLSEFPEANRSIFIMLSLYAKTLDFAHGIDKQLSTCIHQIIAYQNQTRSEFDSDYMWYKRLKNCRIETVMFLLNAAFISAWEKDKIRWYRERLKDMVLFVTGNDLISLGIAPGIVHRQLLEALFDYKVHAGLNMTKKEEIIWIERYYNAD